MDEKRLAPGLYDGLLGAVVGQTIAVISRMPEDHQNERVAGKEVQFVVKVDKIQERLLPEWDELTTLEEFEGTLDELREKTRAELVEAARASAERLVIDTYIERLVEQSTYDIPDVLIEREADRLLHNQEYYQYERYGVKAEQVYKLQNRDRDEILKGMLPQGEERLKINLALREVVRAEDLQLEDAEIDSEVDRLVEEYEEQQRDQARQLLSTELRSSVASNVLDKKLRDRLMAIATGIETPEREADASGEASGAEPSAPESGAAAPADENRETQPVAASVTQGDEDGEGASQV
jgi:trigger factor